MLPWRSMLRAALTRGVAPEAFWRLSVREWRALAGEEANVLHKAAFIALAQRFPDNVHD